MQQQQQKSRLAYRYFFFSFSVAFLVLSSFFLFLMQEFRPTTQDFLNLEPVTTDSVTSYYPSREESLTVLFIGIGPNEAAAETFILARFDPAGGAVPVVALPAATLVQNGDASESLSDLYLYGGAEFTRDRLAATLGINIDRYVRMNMVNFLTIAVNIGSVEFDLPHEIKINQNGDASLTLSPGLQLLDGPKVLEIIRYRDEKVDEEQAELARCATISTLTAAIVNQRIDIALSAMVDKIFELVINLVDTDISYADYDDRKKAADFLARLGSDPARPLVVEGRYTESGGYMLSDTYLAKLTQNFS